MEAQEFADKLLDHAKHEPIVSFIEKREHVVSWVERIIKKYLGEKDGISDGTS